MNKQAKTYVISVSAGKGCYRHISMPGDASLAAFSGVILDAFEFTDDHAHAFFMDNRAWSDADAYFLDDVDEDNEERHTCDVTLSELGLEIGRKFVYVFDFGDDWQFQCKILRILDDHTDLPSIISEKGDPPTQYGMDF